MFPDSFRENRILHFIVLYYSIATNDYGRPAARGCSGIVYSVRREIVDRVVDDF